jgi:hypothetical protein
MLGYVHSRGYACCGLQLYFVSLTVAERKGVGLETFRLRDGEDSRRIQPAA